MSSASEKDKLFMGFIDTNFTFLSTKVDTEEKINNLKLRHKLFLDVAS
jgi:hypothetical protein